MPASDFRFSFPFPQLIIGSAPEGSAEYQLRKGGFGFLFHPVHGFLDFREIRDKSGGSEVPHRLGVLVVFGIGKENVQVLSRPCHRHIGAVTVNLQYIIPLTGVSLLVTICKNKGYHFSFLFKNSVFLQKHFSFIICYEEAFLHLHFSFMFRICKSIFHYRVFTSNFRSKS